MRRATSVVLRAATALVAPSMIAAVGQHTDLASVRTAVPSLVDECVVPAGFRPPVTHVYRLRSGGTLIFTAVHHSHAIDDASHAQISAAFDTYKPTFVLVEGAASSQTFPKAIAFLSDAAATGFRSGSLGENLFAVKLATDRHIAFSGWDFSPAEDYRNGLGNGFAMDDIIGAHLARSKTDPFAGDGGQSAVARELMYAGRVRPVGRFDYADWYRRNYGVPFDQATGTPCGAGIGGRITKYETYRRNLNLIRLIGEHDKAGEVVFVEAGANHWLALREYLTSIARSAS